MEISKISDNSIKLKGKNVTLVIDPTSKVDADIVIVTQPLESLRLDKLDAVRLIISGPGEYEAGGMSITGKDVKGSVTYEIHDQSKIMFTTSGSIADIVEDDEFDCLLVKVVGEIRDDVLGPINAKCVVLFGDLAMAVVKSENQEKTTKVNIKKTAEIQGKTFLLE